MKSAIISGWRSASKQVMRVDGKSRWPIALTLMLAFVLLFFAIRGASWPEMLETLQNAQVEYLLLGSLIGSLAYFARGLRWRVLLSAEKNLSPLAVFAATMIGYLGNSFLPARAGDLIRSAVVSRRYDISVSFVLATALTERIADTVALVLVGAGAVLSLGVAAGWLAAVVQVMGAIGLVGIAGLVLAPHMAAWIRKSLGVLPLNRALSTRLLALCDQFLQGLQALVHRRRSLAFVGLTVAIWLVDATGSVVGARALHLSLTLWQALSLLAALGLSSALPSTPGSIGIYQFVAVTVLPLFGFSPSQALTYIIVAQACSYLVVTFWGVVGIWLLGAWHARTGSVTSNVQ